MKKKVLSVVLAFVLAMGAMPTMMQTVLAAPEYYEHNMKIHNESAEKRETLTVMTEGVLLYDDEITGLAETITQGVTGDYAKVKAIHDWVSANVWYDFDWLNRGGGRPIYYMPHDVIEYKRTVCEGYARLTTALLRSIGIPAVFAYSDIHAWNEAYVDGRWMIVDTTWDSLNEYVKGEFSPKQAPTDDFFDITMEEFSQYHRIGGYEGIFNAEDEWIEMTLPGRYTRVTDHMFFGCVNMKYITLPNSVTAIGQYAFRGSIALENMIMSGNIKRIEEGTFFDCYNLRSIALPNGVTSIGDFAFWNCLGMTAVSIPPSVNTIGKDVFKNCINLTIYGAKGSYAETYAKANNIAFAVGTFGDVNAYSSWAKDGVVAARQKRFVPDRIMNNYQTAITRQEFCEMAVGWYAYATKTDLNAVLIKAYTATNPFTDTKDLYCRAAYSLGITSGTSADKFSPGAPITREQAAVMIMNTCKAAGMSANGASTASGFADAGSASSWAAEGINYCKANGIMGGTGGNNFSPKASYTREQSIVTFNNIVVTK